MARGTFISLILLVGVAALALQSWRSTLRGLDERAEDFTHRSDAFRSHIVVAQVATPVPDSDVLAPVAAELRTPIF